MFEAEYFDLVIPPYHNLRVSSRGAKILARGESPVSGGESTPGLRSAEGRRGRSPGYVGPMPSSTAWPADEGVGSTGTPGYVGPMPSSALWPADEGVGSTGAPGYVGPMPSSAAWPADEGVGSTGAPGYVGPMPSSTTWPADEGVGSTGAPGYVGPMPSSALWPADEGVGSTGAPGYANWPVQRRTPRGAKLLLWKPHWRAKAVMHPAGTGSA